MSNKKFIEDEFDLDKFKKETVDKKKENYLKLNKMLLNFISLSIIVLSFVVAILAFDIINYFLDQLASNKIQREAQQIVESSNENVFENQASYSPAPTFKNDYTEVETTEPTLPPLNPTILELRDTYKNDEIVAYLNINDTKINYPVVQAKDNEYYLSNDFSKNKNRGGAIFMDFENKLYPLSKNTVIYGHNMKNGTMFHNMRLYFYDNNFYKTHNIIELDTVYEKTKWEVFSYYKVTTDYNYIATDFANEKEFSEFLKDVKSRSVIDTGVNVDAKDEILTLSTCTNASQVERYVVQAKRVE